MDVALALLMVLTTAGSHSVQRELLPKAKAKAKAADELGLSAKQCRPSVITDSSRAEAAMACPPIVSEAWDELAIG